jgi:hypothetical protein
VPLLLTDNDHQQRTNLRRIWRTLSPKNCAIRALFVFERMLPSLRLVTQTLFVPVLATALAAFVFGNLRFSLFLD